LLSLLHALVHWLSVEPPVPYLPGGHIVCVLVPLHQLPAEQLPQEVRVFKSPPLVNEPAGQVVQLPAPAPLYLLSLLHALVHWLSVEPPMPYLPAGHALHAAAFSVPLVLS
jgi:hypothetical protein